jgi:hypothetical protein
MRPGAGAWHAHPGPQGTDGAALADSARPIPNTEMSLRVSEPPQDGHVAPLSSALDHVNSSNR